MKTKCASFVGKNSLIILLLSPFFLTTLRADTFINEKFDAALSETWRTFPKDGVSAMEGMLTLSASDEINKSTPAGYAATKMETKSPLLNLSKNNVTIKMTGLDIKGSVAAPARVFQFRILSDKPGDDASSQLYLRISGDGNLALYFKDSSPTSSKAIYETKVSFPIKTLQLATTPQNITISHEDSNGSKEQSCPLTSSLTPDWDRETNYLRIQAQRNPGEGNCQVELRSININSTPSK